MTTALSSLNPLPFSLETTFLPEDAREDKIDLELRGWEVHGLGSNLNDVHEFKQFACSPSEGMAELAWPTNHGPAVHGSFFLRPAMKGYTRDRLIIRKFGLTDKINNRRHEAPLCSGYCLFHRDKLPHPETLKTIHRAKLTLSLNVQRFMRHQSKEDNPALSTTKRLQRRKNIRYFNGDEFAFDKQDNWLPNAPNWSAYSKKEVFKDYLNLITKEVDERFKQATQLYNVKNVINCAEFKNGEQLYFLSAVENLWEFPSVNPIADVLEIGAKLMHLKLKGGSVKVKLIEFKEAKKSFELALLYYSDCGRCAAKALCKDESEDSV